MKLLLESLGATITPTVSKKTDLLVLGLEPGATKFSQGLKSATCKVVRIGELKRAIEGGICFDELGVEMDGHDVVGSQGLSMGYLGKSLKRQRVEGPSTESLPANA
jgi:hypothetical protein